MLVLAVIDAAPDIFTGGFSAGELFRCSFSERFFGVEKVCFVGNVNGLCSDRYICQDYSLRLFHLEIFEEFLWEIIQLDVKAFGIEARLLQ